MCLFSSNHTITHYYLSKQFSNTISVVSKLSILITNKIYKKLLCTLKDEATNSNIQIYVRGLIYVMYQSKTKSLSEPLRLELLHLFKSWHNFKI